MWLLKLIRTKYKVSFQTRIAFAQTLRIPAVRSREIVAQPLCIIREEILNISWPRAWFGLNINYAELFLSREDKARRILLRGARRWRLFLSATRYLHARRKDGIGSAGWRKGRKTTTILYIFRWEKFPDYDGAWQLRDAPGIPLGKKYLRYESNNKGKTWINSWPTQCLVLVRLTGLLYKSSP